LITLKVLQKPNGLHVVLPPGPPLPNPALNDPEGLASLIKYHAKYSPSFNPAKFEPKQAYFATAQSVRDTLIHRWNKTYKHFQATNAKAVHYLSMEYLQVVLQ
jgi:starch phosphorylase